MAGLAPSHVEGLLDCRSTSITTRLALYTFRTGLRLRLLSRRARVPLYGLVAERYIELGFTIEHLPRAPGRVLDIGSERSVLPSLLAARGWQVTALDLCDYVTDQLAYSQALGVGGRLTVRVADATCLEDAADSLDLVTCISTIEHFPDDGDSRCIRELGRVLRPGGRLLLTTPIWHEGYDLYRDGAFYGRTSAGEPIFFERIYDAKTLSERIIQPSGLDVLTVRCFFPNPRHLLNSMARALWRSPTRGLSALIESATYTDRWPPYEPRRPWYGVVCLVLQKPGP